MNVGSFFVEAQIMWSIKLLIRLLLYLAEPIREYMYDRNTHAEKKRKIPMPCRILCDLSRDRWNPDDGFSEERFLLQSAVPDDIIGQYIIFCHVMDEQIKKYGRVREAALETIRICRDRNVLKKYLEEREKEVVNIMIELFNQELAVKEYGDEREEKGRNEGRNEITQLSAKLFSLGKGKDVEKATKDPNYMQKLLKDYGLAEG